ncbi:MAG: hypothetical protein R3D27_15345 [Hyphomicrobiaceae bacterium]
MHPDQDQLEKHLLILGGQELWFETRIRDLQRIAREEGLAGRFEASDAAWDLRQQLKAALASLQVEIMQTERKLYGLRRNARR